MPHCDSGERPHEASMRRTMDEILAKDPSPAPERSETAAEPSPKPDKEPAAETPKASETPAAAAPKQETKPPTEHEEHEDESVPSDFEGLKKALAAARGDKRRERKKWQEIEAAKQAAERELAVMRGQIQVYQQHGARPASPAEPSPAPKPAFDLTEEDFFGKGPEAVKAYVNARLEADRREAAANQKARDLERSERAARKRHADFDQKLATFKQSAPPHIVQQMLADDDPAEFVYDYASTFEQVKDTPTLEALEAKIEARLRAKIEAEIAAKQPAPAPARPPIPRSTAGARGNGVSIPAAWTGPRSLDEILSR